MQPNLMIEWSIAREKQRDALRQVEKERLLRRAEAKPGSRARADRRARNRLRMWLKRHGAMT